jgi:glycosyltransferase involved in cell wall biosynthesis
LNELYGFYREIKDDSRFHLSGFVSDEALVNYYHHAEVNILISRDEGYGFSYLEAGTCGTPSVLADTRISREIAGDSAIYVDPEEPSSIAKGIKEILVKKTYDEKSAFTKKQIKKYSPEHFESSMKDIINAYRPKA